jgi:hypothetical protein
MKQIIVFVCVVSCLSVCAQNRLEQIKKVWEARLEKAGGKGIPQPHYPTEEGLIFVSAYDFTRDGKFAEQVVRQMELAHNQTKLDMVMTPHKATRDYQARQIYNFYLTYRMLGDGKYLRWADDAAAAMLKIIPRQKHTVRGETHTLFAAGYIDPVAGAKEEDISYAIDVNQNAEVGLAYGLLYHDPASKFFLDPLAKEIAYDETLASMSIQNMKTGEIPLTDYRMEDWDTLYGSYGSFLWVFSRSLWHDPQFDPHIKLAGKWLATKMNLEKGSERWYPERKVGPMSDWEASFRIPLYWYCGIDAKDFIAGLFSRPGSDERNYSAAWAWYDLIGVPRAYYVEGDMSGTGASFSSKDPFRASEMPATRPK